MKTTITILALLPLLLIGCGEGNKRSSDGLITVDAAKSYPKKELPESRQIVEGNTGFAFDLFHKMIESGDTSNTSLVVSPFSVSCVLSMMMNGAGSDCLDEIRKVLCLDSIPLGLINDYHKRLADRLRKVDSQTELGFSNSVWVDKDFDVGATFQKISREVYDAEIRNLDFFSPGAVDVVNRWCAEKTENRIPKILEAFKSEDRLVLINALYFHGKWKLGFRKEDTRLEPFTAVDGNVREVAMMCQTESFRLARNEFFDIAELPYGNGSFSLVVLLPSPEKNRDACWDSFTEENWRSWDKEWGLRRLDLKLPRFKIEGRQNLNITLRAMGMIRPFAWHESNFPHIAQGRLKIGDVLQNTFIAVDEGGTEAAAVTAATIIAEEELPPSLRPYPFHVNRPFLFLIRERNSGTILFMGRVSEVASPSKNNSLFYDGLDSSFFEE